MGFETKGDAERGIFIEKLNIKDDVDNDSEDLELILLKNSNLYDDENDDPEEDFD